MRAIKTILLLACLGVAGPSFAQNWTAEQQGVIDDLKECWDIWVEAAKDADPSPWIDNCTDDFKYWVGQGAPADADDVRRNWSATVASKEFWVSLDPITIQIFDDIAIVHFYGAWSVEGPDGRTVDERKRTEVFRKSSERWLLVAGHGTPTDVED